MIWLARCTADDSFLTLISTGTVCYSRPPRAIKRGPVPSSGGRADGCPQSERAEAARAPDAPTAPEPKSLATTAVASRTSTQSLSAQKAGGLRGRRARRGRTAAGCSACTCAQPHSSRCRLATTCREFMKQQQRPTIALLAPCDCTAVMSQPFMFACGCVRCNRTQSCRPMSDIRRSLSSICISVYIIGLIRPMYIAHCIMDAVMYILSNLCWPATLICDNRSN